MRCLLRIPARPRATGRSTGAVILAFLAVATLAGCSKSHPSAKGSTSPTHSPSPKPSPASTAPPSADFSTQGVRAVDPQDRAASNTAANNAAKQVLNLIDTYYNTAFLQPSNWGNGTFPTLSSLFTPDAGGSAAANLQALSLGPLATQIARVNPSTETTNVVSVLIEPNGNPSYATVTTRFQATTQPVGTAAPVTILQSAQFMIDATSFKIAGYDVSTSFNGAAAAASYSPPAGSA
jgi:hypothetical protein